MAESAPSLVCPFTDPVAEIAQAGARFVRDPAKPGWLLLYDRQKGHPPGMASIPWDATTRWVVMWRPVPGQDGKILFHGLPDKKQAKEVLTAAAKGQDLLHLWSTSPPAKPPASPPASPATAGACPPPAPAGIMPADAPEHTENPPEKTDGEDNLELAFRRLLPPAALARHYYTISQKAVKQVVCNGSMVEVPDYATILKALDRAAQYTELAKKDREDETGAKELDHSDLQRMILTSPDFRDELRKACTEAEQTGQVKTPLTQ